MVTVIPIASSDGEKKPIFIIFKGKGKTKEDKDLITRKDCIVMYSDNGWAQTATTTQFLHANFSREDNNEQLIIWDSYRCHYVTQEVKSALKDLNLVNIIIPGGCTRVIQTCDVAWNSPLKAYMRAYWEDWMKTGDKTFTKGGNMRSMSKTQLVNNIVQAWDKISSDTIIKSFKVCGQVLKFNPDDILCMRKDRPCADSLQK